MREEKLLRQLKQKKRDALDHAIRQYTGYVSVIIQQIIGAALPREDVEEAVMDTFLSLWNHAEQLDESQNSIRAYLAAIARNTAKNKLRRHAWQQCQISEAATLAGAENVEGTCLQAEEKAFLLQVVSELPPPDAEIFYRFYYQEEKIEEIAAALQLNASTVKSKLLRGRKKLRSKLLERGYRGDES